jgi:hypothetical protein
METPPIVKFFRKIVSSNQKLTAWRHFDEIDSFQIYLQE